MAYQELRGNSYLFGANAPFIEALYERYLEDPAAVEPRWRTYFDELQKLDDGAPDVAHAPIQEYFAQLARSPRTVATAGAGESSQLSEKQYGVLQMIGAYRFQGARIADVDPLRRQEPPAIAELDPAFYGLSDADMETIFHTGSLFAPRDMKLKDILQMLRDTYCRTIGTEYMYIADIPQKRWIQERLESSRSKPAYDAGYKKHILERLTAAETLERYLHTRYVGQTRFSLEGGDSLIPMLDNLLQRAGGAGVQELVIGMAH
ncbi:MAG: sucA, partial [Betaproteobacteria bacterium]|nr:sucA [Betaproteobacteria bacterium]